MDFESIYKEYFGEVYGFILKISRRHEIAEDITQETFIKAIENIDKFKGDCKVSAWLCQIAKNTYFSYLKKSENRLCKQLDECENLAAQQEDFAARVSLMELHKALHNLPEPYREVFTLKTFGELTLAEISQLFDKSESWGRVTYLRAKVRLKEILKEDGYE